MDIKSFEDGVLLIDNNKVEARRIYTSEKINTVQINLKPGAEIETHTTAEDVLFYVLEGEALLQIDGNDSTFSKGQYAECPGGIEKGIINNSDEMFKVLVVKMDIV